MLLKNKLLVFVLLFFLAFNLMARSSADKEDIVKSKFFGTVIDSKTHLPLKAASIIISDIKIGGITDNEGKFYLNNIANGKHLAEVSHIGYNTIAVVIDIENDTRHDFELIPSVVENNAVVITGSSSATQLKKVPFQVTVLRRQELLQNSSTNIIEALAKKPGIATVSSGPAVSKPVIRGLGYNRVLTINDGVRQEGQQWGDEHGIEIDEASVNKVEILKGPASLMYGSDAMAGVINIITNVPVEDNSIRANLLSNYQSNNNLRSVNVNVAGNVNGFNWNVYNTINAAADYRNKYDGRVFNSKFRQHNFGGYAGYNGGWGYSHILFSNFNLNTGMVEGERDDAGAFIKPLPGGNSAVASREDFTSTLPQIPFQQIRHFKIAADNSFKAGKNRLSLNVGYQQNQRQEFGNADDMKERSLFFDLKTITYTAQLHLAEKKGWKTSVGIGGMQQQNTNRGVEQLIPDYNLLDIGSFVYTQKTMDKITWSGGVRFDNRSLHAKALMEGEEEKGAAFSKSFSNISGSAGMAAQLSRQFNFKLNVARGFRAPGIAELSSNGAHEGTTRYEYGDNNLKSETSTQADAALEYNAEHLSINVAVYRNSISNFIFYRKLQSVSGGDSLINTDDNVLTGFTFSQGNAVLSGIEASLDIHPHPLDWLHIENTFSLTNGRLKQSGVQNMYLPFMPAPRLISELRCNFSAKKIITNFYASIEVDNTFRQHKIFTAYNTETSTPAYTLLNASAGADFVAASGKTLFSLHLSASNLTDVAYQNHLSRLKYTAPNVATGRTGVFNMGRNFSVKLNIPLHFTVKKS